MDDANDLPSRDPVALEKLRQKIEAAAKSGTPDPLTYDCLFDGIEFNLPAPYPRVICHPWREEELEMVNAFLGRICVDSLTKHGLMDTVIVVDGRTGMPGGGFFRLATKLNVTQRRDDRDVFFLQHRQKVYDRYAKS